MLQSAASFRRSDAAAPGPEDDDGPDDDPKPSTSPKPEEGNSSRVFQVLK